MFGNLKMISDSEIIIEGIPMANINENTFLGIITDKKTVLDTPCQTH